MRSTRRPSIFVWPSFPGRISERPRRRSRCTHCWIYAATSRASSTFLTASCTTSPLSTPAFFLTRAKSNMNAPRVSSAPTDWATGIICDQTIALDGHYTGQHYPEHLRRIRLRDAESGKTLVFLTNQFGLPAATVCALYKSRWQVELFFKWIKQHLRIKQFFGTSENAVKTQIWIAVSVYVLVAIVKKRLKLEASLYTLLQILSVTLFEKLPLDQALTHDADKGVASQITNQLDLFAY